MASLPRGPSRRRAFSDSTGPMKWTTRIAYHFLPSHTWSQIRNDWALTRRRWRNDRNQAARLLASRRDLNLHLGCGTRITPGWVNIDAFEQPQLDLRWDLRDRLPCEAGVASLVYSEHVLEHFEKEDADTLLREVFRLLVPGGRIRIGVPAAGRYLRHYVGADQDFFHALRTIGSPVQPLDTPLKVINQMFRMGGAHRFAWDFDTLSQELARAGFVQIGQWASGESSRADLCLDDPAHALETLYVEADKPA
jgi:predicted SAM-dependent methyltransferase